MVAKIRLVLGIVFGGGLALAVVWIMATSVGEAVTRSGDGAFLAQVPLRSASSSLPAVVAAPPAQKKAIKKVNPPPVFAPVPSSTPADQLTTRPTDQPVVQPPTPPPISTSQPPAPPPVSISQQANQPTNQLVSQPIISEVFAGSEASGEDEFIELYNPHDQPVDLTGYAIKKKTSSGSESSLVAAARLQGKRILPHSYFLLVKDGAQIAAASDAAWAKSNSLAAKNNAIGLYDGSGKLIDQASWSEIAKGSSYARRPLMSGGGFSVQSVPTPGR